MSRAAETTGGPFEAVVEAALARAYDAATRQPALLGAPDGGTRQRRVVIGDPQAPLPRVLSILARHGLLGSDGRLLDSVQLISIGDHFD